MNRDQNTCTPLLVHQCRPMCHRNTAFNSEWHFVGPVHFRFKGVGWYFSFLFKFCFVCFVWFDSLRPINNLSVKQGRVFLGWTSTKLGQMCLAQGPQRSDSSEARTRILSISSQALYHWATALPIQILKETSVSKQWKTWSDAVFCSIWSGFSLLADVPPQKGR